MENKRQTEDQQLPGGESSTRFWDRLGTKLLVWFLLLAITPLTIVSLINYNQARSNLYDAASNALLSISQHKTETIGNWFSRRLLDLQSQASSSENIRLLSELHDAYDIGDMNLEDFVESYHWAMIVDEHASDLRAFQKTFGYYDILLIDHDGNILFTVNGESDLGTNLFTGAYSKALFSGACARSLWTGTAVFSDLESYSPSDNAVSGFLISPLVDEEDENLGLVAFQISLDRINQVTQNRAGLGETGESYLVGVDFKMRSSSVHNHGTVLVTEVTNPATESWFTEHVFNELLSPKKQPVIHKESVATTYTGLSGREVLGVHGNILIGDVSWAIISEIDRAEAFAGARSLAYMSLSLLALTILLVVVAVYRISRAIVRPVENLTRIALLAAHGGYDNDIEIKSADEIGELAQSIDEMLRKRRQAEVRLQAERDFTDTIIRSMPGLFYMFELSSARFVRRNTNWGKVTGFTEKELDELTALDLVADRDLCASRMQRVYDSGSSSMESSLLTKPGEQIPYYFTGDRLDIDGEAYIVGMGLDVSERKLMEELLRQSKERLEYAMAVANDGVWDWDLTTNTIVYDDRYFTMAGYEPGEFPSTLDEWEKRVHPDDTERATSAMEQCLAERGRDYEVEFRYRRKNGDYMWILAKGQVVTREDEGEPIRFVGTHSDITARKRAEQILTRQKAQLERINIRYEQLNAELKSSNDELDEFAYIASHDLKEPLRGIHNYSQFLLEDYEEKLDDDGVRKLQTLITLTQRMENLINSLLEFSRLGRSKLAYIETDLDDIVKGVMESLSIRLSETGVEVRIPRPLPTVKCDRVRIAELFRNLVTNAIKYGDKPKRWIEIGYTEPTSDDNSYAFYVADNGIGIKKNHIDRIFNIFERLHGRDKFGGGTGVGLTIARKIVERHGGTMTVESEHGVGSKFIFTIRGEDKHDHYDQNTISAADHNADRRQPAGQGNDNQSFREIGSV